GGQPGKQPGTNPPFIQPGNGGQPLYGVPPFKDEVWTPRNFNRGRTSRIEPSGKHFPMTDTPTQDRRRRRSLKSHQGICRICRHDKHEDIDRDFVGWGNVKRIASDYGVSVDSVYRHATAMGLYEQRRKNVKKALERIIERSEDVEITANAVVS